MNNINEIIKVLKTLENNASIEDITKNLCKERHVIYDGYYKTIVTQTLENNKDKFTLSKLTNKWNFEVSNKEEYLFVSDNRYFNTIREAMLELFDMSVSSGGAYFKIKDSDDCAWFPKCPEKNSLWTNTLSEDRRIWREKNNQENINTENNNHLEEHKRYAFEFVRHEGRYKYHFTGVFKQTSIEEDGTRVYEIVDDKLLIRRQKYLLVCNIAYMKEYRGITDDDYVVGGAGQFTTENHDGGEKENFLPHEDGITYGFVETGYTSGEHTGDINYARKIEINGFSKRFENSDYATNVRVVFIAKGPDNKHIVVGWYENATVYREKQRNNGRFGYNITCNNNDAHLIPEQERIFAYPKKNEDGSHNFGQSNVSYPFNSDNEKTLKLANELYKYIDLML